MHYKVYGVYNKRGSNVLLGTAKSITKAIEVVNVFGNSQMYRKATTEER